MGVVKLISSLLPFLTSLLNKNRSLAVLILAVGGAGYMGWQDVSAKAAINSARVEAIRNKVQGFEVQNATVVTELKNIDTTLKGLKDALHTLDQRIWQFTRPKMYSLGKDMEKPDGS